MKKLQRSKNIHREIKENTASMKQEWDALKMKQSENKTGLLDINNVIVKITSLVKSLW